MMSVVATNFSTIYIKMTQENDRQKAFRLLQDDKTGYGAPPSAENIRADLLEAIEAMQQAGIVLRGPSTIDPQNLSRTIRHTYATLKAKIQQAEISELRDISNSLLMLHFQGTQGGRRKPRVKKSRRTRKHHHRSRRAKRS